MGKALRKPVRLLPVPAWLLMALALLVGKRAEMKQLGGSLRVDSAKARKVLGWTPSVTLDEGLRRAVQDSRERT
jgi:nucleoside-diphosphate-sugar epimerase